jgi:hypothetical protein
MFDAPFCVNLRPARSAGLRDLRLLVVKSVLVEMPGWRNVTGHDTLLRIREAFETRGRNPAGGHRYG